MERATKIWSYCALGVTPMGLIPIFGAGLLLQRLGFSVTALDALYIYVAWVWLVIIGFAAIQIYGQLPSQRRQRAVGLGLQGHRLPDGTFEWREGKVR